MNKSLNWREPTEDEVVVYVVTDTAETSPSISKYDVIKVSVSTANARIVVSARFPSDVAVRIQRTREGIMLRRDDVDFTPAAAWARYIDRQESIIEDLKGEVEVREKYLSLALSEHVKVGPSGSSMGVS